MEEERNLTVQSPHLMPALSVRDAAARFKMVQQFVGQIMAEGTDFGTIPGTNKPTLFKPGAEKLTTFFGLTVEFDSIETVEDWTGKEYDSEPFFYYWFRCRLSRGDRLIAEADGSCNGWESRYRWRWVSADDIPPGHERDQLKTRRGSISEFVFAVDKAETSGQYGKPSEHWQQFQDAIASGKAKKIKRNSRAGKEYDAWEIDTTVYRVPNEDVFSQVNTLKKMAQKRALVAATLIAVNASEFFTQDLEDLDVGTVDAEYHVVTDSDNGDTATSKPAPKPTPKPKPETRQEPDSANGKPATIKTANWSKAAKAIADDLEHYRNKNGSPNFPHLVNAAGKLGYAEITDENLVEVCQRLRDRVEQQQD